MALQITISLETFRCRRCGIWYAVQEGAPKQTCPAGCYLKDSEEQSDRYREWLRAAERRVNSLRGVITRLKRGK